MDRKIPKYSSTGKMKSKGESVHSNSWKRRNKSNKSNKNWRRQLSKAVKNFISLEYQIKSCLTWEHADIFHASSNRRQLLKAVVDYELQLIDNKSPHTNDETIDDISVNQSFMEDIKISNDHQNPNASVMEEKPTVMEESVTTSNRATDKSYPAYVETTNCSSEMSRMVFGETTRSFKSRGLARTPRSDESTFIKVEVIEQPSGAECFAVNGDVFHQVQEAGINPAFRNDSGDTPYEDIKDLRMFLPSNNIEKHLFVHSGIKSYKCTESPQMISQGDHLTTHQPNHSREKSYKCSECPQMFLWGSSLKRHQRIHSGEKPYKCNECPQMFAQLSNLKSHQRTHSGEKPYKCTDCPQMFAQSCNLRAHQRIHSGEKPYKCSKCPQTFSLRGNLMAHQRTHSGAKPYKCPECGQMFSRTGSLKRHQHIHSGEKPFKCRECPQMFSQSAGLKRHERVHSGEKPYKCTECPLKFAYRWILTTHQRTHSGEKPLSVAKL